MGNLSGQIVSQIFSLKLKEIFSRIVFAEQHCNRHPKVRLPNGSSCRSFIQGFQFQKHLESGKIESVSALARKEHMDRAFLFRALSLVNLAPDIINLILDGREPKTITLNKLRKGFPEDWDEQRAFFGIK